MNRNERGVIGLVVGLAAVVAAFALAMTRGALFSADWLSAQLPLRSVFAAGLRSGSLSLWSPLQYGGVPLLASGQVAALYPPSAILHALFPVITALQALVLLHLLWAAAGTYLLARKWSVSSALAASAAVAFALGGLLFSPIADLNGWMAMAWLPWLLLLTDRVLDTTTLAAREAGLKALALGMALLAGGAAALPGLLLSAAYALYLLLVRKPRLSRLVWLIVATGLGALLYLPQFLPSREWAAWSASTAGDGGLVAEPMRVQTWLPLAVLLVAVLAARGLGLILSRGKWRVSGALPALVLIAALLATYVVRQPAQQDLNLARPASVDFLQPQTGIYRLYTQERAHAVPSAARESLSGGVAAAYGLPTASSSGAALPRLYSRFASELAPNTLNLLGVKYYLIPQPHGEDGKEYDLDNPFAYNPMDTVTPSPVVMSSLVEIEWYLSESAEMTNGDPVALLTLIPEEMDEALDFFLSVGSHVSDWAYDRSDVKASIRHNQAVVVRTFPARSGNPPEDHVGYVYRAIVRLPYATLTQGLWFQSFAPPERIHIERVTMIDDLGNRYVAAVLAGRSDHVLVYRTEDVAIFENYDVLPRAFLAYSARAVPDDNEAMTLLRSSEFNPRQEIVLAAGEAMHLSPPTEGAESISIRSYEAEKVALDVTAPAAGYLVLTDAWYPGWQVLVDGQAATLERADVMFRAVYIEPGKHTVEFVYRPAPFRTGLMAAAIALLAALVLVVLGSSQRKPAAIS